MKKIQNSIFLVLFRLLLIGVILTTISLSLAPIQPARADPQNGTGPGGVGNRLGTSDLELWLRADVPGYQQSDCTSPVTTDDQRVGCWPDQSGSGNNVTAAGLDNRPTYENDAGNTLNGKPVLQFGNIGGINRYLQTTTAASGQSFTLITVSVPAVATAEYASVFSSATASTTSGSFQFDAGGTANQCAGNYRLLYQAAVVGRACAGTLGTTGRIVSARVTSGTNISTWNNGTNVVNNVATTLQPVFNVLRVGLNRNANVVWPNDIAEVILYYGSLTTAQRTLVENYLQAKYNDSATNPLTISNDRYDGDTTANGDFDLDVAGIGREADGLHTHAHSTGMLVTDSTFLNDSGDYLMFGHKNPINGITAEDLPNTAGWGGAYDARWVRHWYIDVTDAGANGGTVDIVFDFDEVLVAADPGIVANYRLLRRSATTGQFSDIAIATSVDTGENTITFSGVSVADLGSNFTLGTLDQQDSPISDDPTAVTMLDMTSASLPGGAQVSWTTAQEVDTVLFNVYRSETPDGERALVEQVLPQGLPGASYLVEDRGLTPFNTYYYWLEVVGVHETETFELSPVTAWGSYFLPFMVRSP